MEIRKSVLPIQEAKEINIVNYLPQSGYEITEVRAFDYWYFSPLKNEKTPSVQSRQKIKLVV